MAYCKNPESSGVLVSEMYWSKTLTGKQVFPPTICCCGAWSLSGAMRISSLVRHTYVRGLYLFSPFAVYSICMYVVSRMRWVRATAISN